MNEGTIECPVNSNGSGTNNCLLDVGLVCAGIFLGDDVAGPPVTNEVALSQKRGVSSQIMRERTGAQ